MSHFLIEHIPRQYCSHRLNFLFHFLELTQTVYFQYKNMLIPNKSTTQKHSERKRERVFNDMLPFCPEKEANQLCSAID